MTPDQYLNAVVDDQTFAPDDPELTALRERGNEVKGILRSSFSSHSPSVRNAGSYEKGTMIRASYDLDILVYFASDTTVGSTLEAIYIAVNDELDSEYAVERKRSALRLLDANEPGDPSYFHVDVVPGRFVENGDGDVYLHQTSGEKTRLKTNPEVHIEHVRRSGVRPAIKLMKLWKVNSGIAIPTFALELLVIKLLDDMAEESLSKQLTQVWTEFSDRADSLTITDPANSGNDLSSVFADDVRMALSSAAASTLRQLEDGGWEAVYGAAQVPLEEKAAAVIGAAATISKPSRPYCGER